MTRRICRALENPNVTILAHPTGRLLRRRQPYAVDLKTDSVAVYVADVLVSNGIRFAPPFEHGSRGKVHGLCRRSFGFPQTHLHIAERDVRFSAHLSDGASFFQAAPHRVRTQRPPTSPGLDPKRLYFNPINFGF